MQRTPEQLQQKLERQLELKKDALEEKRHLNVNLISVNLAILIGFIGFLEFAKNASNTEKIVFKLELILLITSLILGCIQLYFFYRNKNVAFQKYHALSMKWMKGEIENTSVIIPTSFIEKIVNRIYYPAFIASIILLSILAYYRI